jgi:non-specific serine/threonine protein kinase/serine/threonine-protein kinase
MPPSRWERIEELFAACVGRKPAERADLLDRSCAGDAELRREVESLLAAHETTEGILDAPPLFRPGAPVMGPEIAGRLLAPGTRLGPWRIGTLIGRGGAGEVYAAHRADGSFEQQVAIKVLQMEAAAQLSRFHAERRILARLEHPGIARLLDGGVTADGRPYAVIEHVEGRPLVEHCRAHGCDLEERLRLFGQVCEAVAHAHRNLVVHRDLKPGNILVDADGRVKLLDFGIAKLLDVGDKGEGVATDLTRAPLTPDYAAPEQLTGEPVTTATDVYALGVLLFELLTGERPWRSGDLPVASAVRLLLEKEAPPASRAAREARPSDLPDLPVPARALEGDLDAIIAKCLRKQPEHRYESVAALWQDIERHRRREPVRAREGAGLYVLGRLLLRHRWAVAGAAALFLSLAAGLTAFAWQARRAEIERDQARRASSREEAIRDHLTHLFRTSLAEPAAEPITAKTMLDRSAQRVLQEYRDDPQLAGEVVVTLADLYGALGDVEGQAPLLEGFLTAAGPEADPQAVALARQKLANIELVRGRPEHAAPLLDQAEAFWTNDPDRFREQRLEGLFVRALLQRSQGDLAGSIATYQKAIGERRALSGEAHRETANLYNSLAITLTAANRLDEALAAHRHALKIYQQIGRGEDLEALVLLGNIGTLAFRTGRIREAEEILATAYRKQRATAGDSAAVAAAMGLYGAALTAQGRTAEALPVLRDAVDMAVRFTGPSSPLAVQDRQFLTDALAAAGEIQAARSTLRENQEIARRQFGPDHILTLRLRLAQARLAQTAGQPADAHAQAVALLPALRTLGGSSAPWIAHAQVIAGEALLALDRPREATAALREAVALREKLLFDGSWELAEARARLGEALVLGNADDSEGTRLLEKAEAALRAELGADHPQTVRATRALAEARRKP